MKSFTDYKEFEEYYINHKQDDMNTFLYCETISPIYVYRKCKGFFNRLFKKKELVPSEEYYCIHLNPIFRIDCLKPNLEEVEVAYMKNDGEVIIESISPRRIYCHSE